MAQSVFSYGAAGTGTLTPGWRIHLVAPAASVELFSAALQPFAVSVSASGDSLKGDWVVEAYAAAAPDPTRLATAVGLAAAAAGIEEPPVACVPVGQTDWLAENLVSFQPVRAGRFFVYPSHHRDEPPVGAIPIRIDAATAFGSGEHGSTRGCLHALDRLAAIGRFDRALDLGCGSGILSIAIARLWHARVTAADIDPIAVRVCRENMSLNGVSTRVRALQSNGLTDRALRAAPAFDLIVANILARPLMAMARDLTARLAPGGVAVLSGLLAGQEAQILGAYRRCGLVLQDRITIDGWRTLILRRAYAVSGANRRKRLASAREHA